MLSQDRGGGDVSAGGVVGCDESGGEVGGAAGGDFQEGDQRAACWCVEIRGVFVVFQVEAVRVGVDGLEDGVVVREVGDGRAGIGIAAGCLGEENG